MRHRLRVAAWLTVSLLVVAVVRAEERSITEAELVDKATGFWLGQLVGNYLGLPFENKYVDEPLPMLVDRIYTYADDEELQINRKDHRGFIPMLAIGVGGAFSDDDTDIEFVTLHAVEKYGLDITHAEITEMWKKHINRKIWVANATARGLMDRGLVAPDTGRKENNPNWWAIDPQLVNEIWSAFYPGMTKKAGERALWGARITSDDWGTHPTIAYGVMISAAFFEKDPQKLVEMAIEAVPNEGPFAEGMRDVVRWHEQGLDWRTTRQKIHDKYFAYEQGSYKAPKSVVSSLVNGLTGILAVLYGEGEFVRSVGIAVSAGYDCDNQAATVGGLMGVIHGTAGIPDRLTKNLTPRDWAEPFNDLYVNFSRDELPVATPITEIAERIAAIAKTAILDNGGRVEIRPGDAPSIEGKTFTIPFYSWDLTMEFGEGGNVLLSSPSFDDDIEANFVQIGQRLDIDVPVWDYQFEVFYDGENVEFIEGQRAGEITYVVATDF
jgi:hypothetical protein